MVLTVYNADSNLQEAGRNEGRHCVAAIIALPRTSYLTHWGQKTVFFTPGSFSA